MCVLLILYISTHLVVVLSYHEINEIKSNQLILFITAVIDDPKIHHNTDNNRNSAFTCEVLRFIHLINSNRSLCNICFLISYFLSEAIYSIRDQ